MNENELKKFAGLGDFLNNTDFAYNLGSTGKYTVPIGALATLLGSYLNWSKAKDTKVEGETEKERRKRLWKSALVPAALGGLATVGTTAGLAALGTSNNPLSEKSTKGFSTLFKAGLKDDDTGIKHIPEPGFFKGYKDIIKDNVPLWSVPVSAGLTAGGTWGVPSVLGNKNLNGWGKIFGSGRQVFENAKDDVGSLKDAAKTLWNRIMKHKTAFDIAKTPAADRTKLLNKYRSLSRASKQRMIRPGTLRRMGRAGTAGALTAAGLFGLDTLNELMQ